MREFVQKNLVPPSGYFYIVPETGAEIIAYDKAALTLAVNTHYDANDLEVPTDLVRRIEHFLCLRNPISFCKGEFEPNDVVPLVTSIDSIKEATKRMSSRLKWGKGQFLATQLEAERRALICVSCPENRKGICTTCNGLNSYTVEAVGNRTTNVDSQLGLCSHCECLLKVKVHISFDALKVVTKEADRMTYPVNCWMRDKET
jgi:hypothetical protein